MITQKLRPSDKSIRNNTDEELYRCRIDHIDEKGADQGGTLNSALIEGPKQLVTTSVLTMATGVAPEPKRKKPTEMTLASTRLTCLSQVRAPGG